jgi:hypothetical protein
MKKLTNKIKFKLMRFLVSNSYSEPVVKRYQRRIGKLQAYSGSSLMVNPAHTSTHIQSLQDKGFVELDYKLNEDVVNEITSFLNSLSCHDPYRHSYGYFKVEAVPQDTHTAHYRREDIVKSPTIMRLANDPEILKIAEQFLGATPTISNVNAWWSFGDKDRPEEAQNFHRDVDDYKFCKLFIYLTDVTSDSGPHVYVSKTHDSKKLRAIRRYTDDEIIQTFGKENIVELTRPKGSCFLVNTYGFHKGLLPRKGRRLLLQVQYSLNPILIEEYKPIKDHAPYNKYVNRLLIK